MGGCPGIPGADQIGTGGRIKSESPGGCARNAHEITDTLDLKDSKDRDELIKAVNKARVYLSEGTSGVPLFKAWGALKLAGDLGFGDIAEPLKQAQEALSEALSWHEKQQGRRQVST